MTILDILKRHEEGFGQFDFAKFGINTTAIFINKPLQYLLKENGWNIPISHVFLWTKSTYNKITLYKYCFIHRYRGSNNYVELQLQHNSTGIIHVTTRRLKYTMFAYRYSYIDQDKHDLTKIYEIPHSFNNKYSNLKPLYSSLYLMTNSDMTSTYKDTFFNEMLKSKDDMTRITAISVYETNKGRIVAGIGDEEITLYEILNMTNKKKKPKRFTLHKEIPSFIVDRVKADLLIKEL